MTNDDILTTLQQQNDVIISLLARLAFGSEQIVEIVTRGKKDPDAYRKAYNSMNGVRTGTEIAKLAGVTQQTMSYILQTWEEEGIAINIGKDSQAKYRRLMSIPNKASKKGKRANNGNGK